MKANLVSQSSSRPGRGWLVCLCTYALLFWATNSAKAINQQVPSEYEVKAVFLYNFAKFVEWPPNSFQDRTTSIVLCIVGWDPFEGILDATTRGETIGDRAITIRRLTVAERLEDCHILFVGLSERGQLDQIFEALRGKSVLTVGEADDFAQLGGIVQLTKTRYRIGLRINLAAADRANLKISSRLLSLASIVGVRSGSAPWLR